MKQDLITKLHTDFEAICHQDEEIGTEFWLARELQPLLGYSQYRNFEPVIEKAMIACENSGQVVEDHFANVRKMVDIGSGAQREIEDVRRNWNGVTSHFFRVFHAFRGSLPHPELFVSDGCLNTSKQRTDRMNMSPCSKEETT